MGTVSNNRKFNRTLEGRIVLIAGSSTSSRQLRQDIFRDFARDHQLQDLIVRLDVGWGPYNNGNQNFILKDPEGVLDDHQIGYMIKNSQSFLISKLENPFLADPNKYVLDDLINSFGMRYASLHHGISISPAKATPDEFAQAKEKKARHTFQSFVSYNLPLMLEGVSNRKKLEESLIPYTQKIYELFQTFGQPLASVYSAGGDASSPTLEFFKYAFRGLLADVIQPRPKPIFYDELYAMTNKIGLDILQPDDIGQLNWIVPFLDGRSDKIKNTRLGECIRAREDARIAKYAGVNAVLTFRAHSQTQADFFQSKDPLLPSPLDERTVRFINLTQTNEQISLIGQRTNLEETYVLSPDGGGMEDAMVFGRDLYRRSGGKFKGRVLIFKKQRAVVGDVSGMDFNAYYEYDPSKDTGEMDIDIEGRPLPYDLIHSTTYKDRSSERWIGHKFNLVYSSDDAGDARQDGEQKVKEILSGHTALIKDDIIDTGGTMIRAILKANTCYNSRAYAIAEHGCFTKESIKDFDKLYRSDILDLVVTSTSIMHPNPGSRPWHYTLPISERFKNSAKRLIINPWLKQNFPERMDLIQQLTYRRTIS